MAKATKETKKTAPKKAKKVTDLAGQTVKVNQDDIILRDSYTIYFVSPSDERQMNDLRNTGNIIGLVTVQNKTTNDKIDEIIVVLKQ